MGRVNGILRIFRYRSKLLAVLVASAYLLLLGVGCGSNASGFLNTPPSTPPPTSPPSTISVSISPGAIGVQIGNTQQFQASVVNTSNTGVKWLINGMLGGDATHGTISETGLYTAPAIAPPDGAVVISAASSADPTKSAQAIVVVRALAKNFAYLSSPSDDKIQSFIANDQTLEPGPTISVGSGKAPTALAVHATGKFLYSLNRGSNDISIFAINPETGELTGTGTTTTPSAPYAMVFSPRGDFAYVTCDDASVILAYAVNISTGALEQITGSPYPVGGRVQSLAIPYDGRSLYATSPDTSQIIGFRIDQGDGTLGSMIGSPFSAGSEVSSVVATDAYVYTANTGSVRIYRRDYSSGSLSFANSTSTDGSSPELFSNMSAGFLLGVNSLSGGFFAYESDDESFYTNLSAAPTETPAIPGGLLLSPGGYPSAYVVNPAAASIDIYFVYYGGVDGPNATAQSNLNNPTGFAITP